jgi:head-tail adaptor
VEEGGILMMIKEIMEKCQRIVRTRIDDPYGSSTDTWTDGEEFNAAIIKNSTTEATIAEREGITEIFTVVVPNGVSLAYHDVFRRLSDNAVFRVTGDTTDSEAPARSTVQIAKTTAERWDLLSA